MQFKCKALALKSFLAFISFMLFSSVCAADYKRFMENKFWGELYKNGGKTFFCNKRFSKQTPLLAASYIYPSAQAQEFLQCGTKRQCLRSDERYLEIMTDLHNIVAADSYFEFKRKRAQFGNLDSSIEANDCGIRKKLHIIEPADSIKGDIARILFYMHDRYQLPLQTHLSLLRLWHENDPPSPEEVSRDALIKQLQGNGNQFISSPAMVYNID